jgi:hypothetical protein
MIKRIEFCGLPGSGKSALQEPFIAELRRITGRHVLDREAMVNRCLRRRDDGLIKNTLKRFPGFMWKRFLGLEYALPELHLFVSAKPSLMAQIFQSLARPDTSALSRQCVIYAVFRTILEHCLAVSHLKDEILVADEGFIHRAFTIFGYLRSGVREDEIRVFADSIPFPDALIHIEASPEICEQRLALRAAYPLLLSDLTQEARIEQLRTGCERLRIAVNQVERRGIPVFRIENNGALESGIQQIQRFAAAMTESWELPGDSAATLV